MPNEQVIDCRDMRAYEALTRSLFAENELVDYYRTDVALDRVKVDTAPVVGWPAGGAVPRHGGRNDGRLGDVGGEPAVHARTSTSSARHGGVDGGNA
ncbi:transcriptional regulator, AsnC family [Methylorubrum populi]|uniref:Transcriptional regulator, AsnC family n=1 Tax=Methylorubrum populi TaxID=223967 RepID=A0A169QEG2_9HYPH|nr:hypothetical protein [Methylorubrum populi]BAU88775.1 transcriptional regulator, AsnC family [Methylorubrum populi]